MNKTNFLIDIAIFIAFLVAMEPNFSGVSIHEWLSVALAVTLLVHLLLHWKWIITIGAEFFNKLWHTSRLKYVVDILMFIAMAAIMMSGLMISHVVLPAFGFDVQSGMVWRQLHSTAADAAVLLLGVHFALNWHWVWDKVKKYLFTPVGRMFRSTKMTPSSVTSTDETES